MPAILSEFIAMLDEKARNLKGSVILDITGHGRVHLDETGARAATEGDTTDLTMAGSEKLFRNILSGDQNPVTAVMMGKLKVDGNPMRALKVSEILTAEA